MASHATIGADIIRSMANYDGGALGHAFYTDFLILLHAISRLGGKVLLNVDSVVAGPDVYLKAMSRACYIARQKG
mgnify:FL=1